jgi:hypothetical protein
LFVRHTALVVGKAWVLRHVWTASGMHQPLKDGIAVATDDDVYAITA